MAKYERKCNPIIKDNDIICNGKLVHWRQLNDNIIQDYIKTVINDEKKIEEINKDFLFAIDNAELIDETVKNIVLINGKPIVKSVKNGKPVYMTEEIKTGKKIKKQVNYRQWFWENVLNYKTKDKAVIKK